MSNWPLRVALALTLGAVLCLFAITPRTFAYWQAQREFPFQLDAEEGFILNQAVTLAGSGSIYRAIDQPPFLVGNYPPLFPWVYSLATGPKAGFESLPAGRLMIEIAALLTALGLGVIAGLRTRRVLPALLAALLFFATYEVNHWSAFVRVDFPALLLTVAGLGVFLSVRARWGLVASAGIFVAAGFTRQTALLAPAACAAALLVSDRRRLGWFLAPYAGLGLVVFGVLQWTTGGEFYRHVVVYNKNQMDWGGFANLMKNEVWFFFRWWLVALGWGIVWRIVLHYWSVFERLFVNPQAVSQSVAEAGEDARAPRDSVTTFYFALGALSILSYAKVGAAPNYVLEPLAAAALWSAETLGRMLDRLAGGNAAWPWDNLSACLERLKPGREVRLKPAEQRDMGDPNPPAEAGGKEEPAEGRLRCNRAASGIQLIKCGAPGRRVAMIAGWGFAALLLAHGAHLYLMAQRFPWSPVPRAGDRAAGAELLRLLREAPGDVFCEDPVYTLLAGKAVLHQPFIMAQLAKEGRWNQQPMLDWLNAKKFSLFVVTDDLSVGGAKDYERYTPAMAGALTKNYAQAGAIMLPGIRKQYIVWQKR